MSYLILKRNDLYSQKNSYKNIYPIKELNKINSNMKSILLRIVKKTILGTNFVFYYSYKYLLLLRIFRIIFIYLYPKLIRILNRFNDVAQLNENEKNKNLNKDNGGFQNVVFGVIELLFLFVDLISYKYRQKKIDKYMENYAQYSILEENESLKENFIIKISKDHNYSIEIYSKKESQESFIFNKKENIFFYYAINFPNFQYINKYYDLNILLPKEIEIFGNIIKILKDVDEKYRNKSLSFFLKILFILFQLPSISKVSNDLNGIIKVLGMVLLILYVEINNILQMKSEQIEKILLLNNVYITDGYYIYIDNYIISIFFLKEEFRNRESFEKIKILNEKIRLKFDLV